MYKKITLVVIWFITVTTTFAQRPGTVDSTFGNDDGVVYNTIGGNTANEFNAALAIQSDGKIVAGGYTNLVSHTLPVIAVTRYNTDGTLDTSFNHVGYITTVFDTTLGIELVSLAIEPGGKIIGVGGEYDTSAPYTDYLILVRYTANGMLDTTFGVKGSVVTTFGNINPSPDALALQYGGKIVVGLSTSTVNGATFSVARFDSTGTIDSTFGTNGIVNTLVTGGTFPWGVPEYMIIQNNGKIVEVGGYLGADTNEIVLTRYTANGILDTSFGIRGIINNAFNPDSFSIAYSVAGQPDGKLVIAGGIGRSAYNLDPILARFDSSGNLDATFGNKGIVEPKISGAALSVLVQPDGKMVAAGSSYAGFALLRWNSNGTPDTSFGNNGFVSTSIFTGTSAYPWAVKLQPDGKIVASGYASSHSTNNSYFAVVRYISGLTTGILNLSSAAASVLVYPNPVHNTVTLDYTLTNTETLTINLYDVTGQVIKNYMTNETMLTGEHKQQLNFDNLAPGSYILTISNAEGKTESVKIVKQ